MTTSKFLAISMSVIITLAVFWPVTENFKKKPVDRFPLSYYPMFSFKRKALCKLNYVVGYDSAGNRSYVGYKYIGTGGFNQVRRQLSKKINRGDSSEVLEKTAKRIMKSKEVRYKQMVKIELAKGDFDFDIYYLTDNKMPVEEKVLATKIIERQ